MTTVDATVRSCDASTMRSNPSLNLRVLADALPRAGLSPARLAERLGVSREAVSKWVHGEAMPQPDKLLRLGKILGLTYDELVQTTTPAPETVPVVHYRDSGRKQSQRKKVARVAEASAAYGGPCGEIVLYQAPDGTVSLDVRVERETIWLTQAQMAELFATERRVAYPRGPGIVARPSSPRSVLRHDGPRDTGQPLSDWPRCLARAFEPVRGMAMPRDGTAWILGIVVASTSQDRVMRRSSGDVPRSRSAAPPTSTPAWRPRTAWRGRTSAPIGSTASS